MADSYAGVSLIEGGAARTILHPFPTLMPADVPGVGIQLPVVKCLNGYNMVGDPQGRYVLTQPTTMTPVVMAGTGPGQLPIPHYGRSMVHSDALIIGGHGSVTPYAMNLRETGVARNLNNTAAIAGRPFGGNANSGYGWIALNNAGAVFNYSTRHHEDARYWVAGPTVDTTSPTVASPSAPTVAAATTGGVLADGTYYTCLCWITRTNTSKTRCGITAASAETSTVLSGGSGAGRLDVTIPALPTNAIGYVVFCSTTTGAGNQLAVGGGNVAGTHIVRATMAQLAMHNKWICTSNTGIMVGTMGTIENANPFTWATIRASTNNYFAPLWSPFFRDPSQIYMMISAAATSSSLKIDKYDIVSGAAMSLAQTANWDGEPCVITASNIDAGTKCYQSVPELFAYAVGNYGAKTAGVYDNTNVPVIQLRSCLSNEVLWEWTGDIHGDTSTGTSYEHSWYDFEVSAAGTVYCLIASRRHRGILRIPVIMWS